MEHRLVQEPTVCLQQIADQAVEQVKSLAAALGLFPAGFDGAVSAGCSLSLLCAARVGMTGAPRSGSDATAEKVLCGGIALAVNWKALCS